MMLFRYFEQRTLTWRQAGCSRRKRHNARWLGTWPSSVILRGARSACEAPSEKTPAQRQCPDPGGLKKCASRDTDHCSNFTYVEISPDETHPFSFLSSVKLPI